MNKPPFKDVPLAEPDVEKIERDDGAVVLRARQPLQKYQDTLAQMWAESAARAGEKPFIAQRGEDGGWRTITYGEADKAARAIAQNLLERGLGPDKPLMILSGNSINHALLMIAGFLGGIPLAPVSPAYSLMSEDFSKARHVYDLVRPALIYVEESAPFRPVLDALGAEGRMVVAGDGENGAVAFDSLIETEPGPELERAQAALGPDSVAKYLFTSGSTGMPKGVINTHRMLCSNQQMKRQVMPFIVEQPPVLVDWLPWNHTFGGNHDFNVVMRNGGTLYIDGGRPVPGQFEETVRNLKEVAPTIYYNVPAGYAQLVSYLKRDDDLRANFFSRLSMMFYAGAALPQDAFDALQDLSVQTTGERIVIASGWGATETAPSATSTHFPTERAGLIGVPNPGLEIKLVPNADKLEIRVKGPNVTPGYLNEPDKTAEAFDSEGYYRIGDAAKFVDEKDPNKGLIFDGRVAEDFKLATGTWVAVGNLRIKLLEAASPLLQDAVIAGHDRDYLTVMAWPNVTACTDIAETDSQTPAAIAADPAVRRKVRDALAAHNRDHPGSSTRIGRAVLLDVPPDIDAGEITDKGYINQRATLRNRAEIVERLYATPPDDDVLVIDKQGD